MNNKKISLTVATLICLNTMIGAGLFINPALLAKYAGPFGFLGYIIAAIILLPIVLCIGELATLHPVSGGLYVYSQQYLGKRIGFLAAWSFFLAKSVSPILILHKIVSFFYIRSAFLQSFSPLTIDYTALMLLLSLIILGVKIGGRAQYFFISLKSIPVFFVFFMSLHLFSPAHFSGALPALADTMGLLPVAIFALTGFEVICGIGGLIENPERNIRRAILIAFSIMVTIATLFQLVFFGALGNVLGQVSEPVLSLASQAMPNYSFLGSMINSFVFASMMGGVFSMFASVCWYMHTFGTTGHFPFGNTLSKLNRHNVPWVGLLIQGFVAVLLIAITQEQASLQTMSVFALFISYGITTIAAFKARLKKLTTSLPIFVPPVAMIFCSYVIYICLQNIQKAGISFSFLGIFFTGIVIELLNTKFSKVK